MKKNILIMLLMILGIFSFIFVKDEYQSRLLYKANYGMVPLIRRGKVDNLYLGSSLFRQGIDKQILDNDSYSYMLAYNGNQPVMEYWILKHLVDNGVKIKKLYVDLYPYNLSATPSISDSKIFFELNVKDKYSLYKTINSNTDFKELWSIFVTENNEILFSWPIYFKLVNSTYKNGISNDSKPGLTKNEIKKLNLPSVSKKSNTNQKAAIIDIIKLCLKENIKLTFVEMPKYERIMNRKEYKLLRSEYIKILEEYEVSYILESEFDESIKFDSNNFADLFHMSTTGKKKFTKLLKNKISQMEE